MSSTSMSTMASRSARSARRKIRSVMGSPAFLNRHPRAQHLYRWSGISLQLKNRAQPNLMPGSSPGMTEEYGALNRLRQQRVEPLHEEDRIRRRLAVLDLRLVEQQPGGFGELGPPPPSDACFAMAATSGCVPLISSTRGRLASNRLCWRQQALQMHVHVAGIRHQGQQALSVRRSDRRTSFTLSLRARGTRPAHRHCRRPASSLPPLHPRAPSLHQGRNRSW